MRVSVAGGVYFSQSDQKMTVPLSTAPDSEITRIYAFPDDIWDLDRAVTCSLDHIWSSTYLMDHRELMGMFAIEDGWLKTSAWLNSSRVFISGEYAGRFNHIHFLVNRGNE